MKHARSLGLLLAPLLVLASCFPTTEQPQETERFTVEDGDVVLYALDPMLEGDGFVHGTDLRLEPTSPFCVEACTPDAEDVINLTIPVGYGRQELRVPVLSGEVESGYFLVTVEGRRGTVDYVFGR